MTAPVKLNFKVYQGSTFSEVLRWESSTKVYKTITAISKTAPVVINAVAHGIPVGWRTKVTNVVGMTAINSTDTYNTVSAVTADTVTLNDINSLGYTAYTSGGVLEYNLPVDLAGFTARMQIREKLTSTATIKDLTTGNGGVVLDNTLKTITIFMSATDTAALTFSTAVYSLELVSSGGIVTQLITGNMTLVQEVTR
jgi:hypothetical protein